LSERLTQSLSRQPYKEIALKIGIFGIEGYTGGKEDIVDKRIDTLKQMFNSGKKVFIQAEIVTDEIKLVEADVIVCPEGSKLPLYLMMRSIRKLT
jgi:hypothetical protein